MIIIISLILLVIIGIITIIVIDKVNFKNYVNKLATDYDDEDIPSDILNNRMDRKVTFVTKDMKISGYIDDNLYNLTVLCELVLKSYKFNDNNKFVEIYGDMTDKYYDIFCYLMNEKDLFIEEREIKIQGDNIVIKLEYH